MLIKILLTRCFYIRTMLLKEIKMINKKLLKKLITATILLLVFSCNNELSSGEKSSTKSETEIALERVRAMGFNTEGYQILGEHIMVEGDILINMSDVLPDSSRQYTYVDHRVSANHIANVKLCNKLDSSWDYAFNEAIKEFNNVPGTKIRLFSKDYYGRSYSENEADINVLYDKTYFEKYNAYALGELPPYPNGITGSKVIVNIEDSDVKMFDNKAKKKLLMHEIGHCLGFPHQYGTIDVEVEHIHGTPLPTKDDGSIMEPWMGSNDPANFTDGDIKMMQILYPKKADTPYIDLYEHSGFWGLNYRLYEETYQLPYDNTLSSIKFYNGANILLYEGSRYRGKPYGCYFLSIIDYRGHTFNDRASSIKFISMQQGARAILNKTFSNNNDWSDSNLYHYSTPEKLYNNNFAINGMCEAYITNGVLHTYISDRGSDIKDIYFKTTGLIFDGDRNYEVSFKARTENNQQRSIKVAIGEGLVEDPYENKHFRIDDNMSTYSFMFKPNRFTSNGTLIIYMGNSPLDNWSKDVILDDIKITAW